MKKLLTVMALATCLLSLGSCSQNQEPTKKPDNGNLKFNLTTLTMGQDVKQAKDLYDYYYVLFSGKSKEMELTYKSKEEEEPMTTLGTYEKLENLYSCDIAGQKMNFEITSPTTLKSTMYFATLEFELDK